MAISYSERLTGLAETSRGPQQIPGRSWWCTHHLTPSSDPTLLGSWSVNNGALHVDVEGSDDLGEALLDGHAAGIAGDERLCRGVGVVGDDDGGRVAAQSGDDELAQDAEILRQPDGGLVYSGSVVAAGSVQGDRRVSVGLRALMSRRSAGERIRRMRNLTPRASSSASTGWVVTFWSVTSMCGSVPLACFQWSQKAMTSRFSGGLGDIGVGVDEVVGAAVLGEGQYRAGTLGAGGHVVLVQGGSVPQAMMAWKSRSKIASSLVASPSAIIFVSSTTRKARWWSWLVR